MERLPDISDRILHPQATEPSDVAFSVVPLTVIAYTVLFFVSVYATLRVARRLNLEDPRNTDAFLVTILKNAGALGGVYLAGLVPDWTMVIIPVVLLVIPILLYQRIFAATLRESATMWAVVFAVELLSAVVLLIGARLVGAWLDQRFDLNNLLKSNS